MYKNILIPTVAAKSQEEVLNTGIEMAKRFDASVHVLCVVELVGIWATSPVIDVGLMHQVIDSCEKIAIDAANTLQAGGVSSVKAHVKKGHPAELIIQAVNELDCDLIIMGTHGHRGLERVLLGSVAEEVVRNSSVSIHLVRI